MKALYTVLFLSVVNNGFVTNFGKITHGRNYNQLVSFSLNYALLFRIVKGPVKFLRILRIVKESLLHEELIVGEHSKNSGGNLIVGFTKRQTRFY